MKEFSDIKSVVKYILEQEFIGSKMTPDLLNTVKKRLIQFLPDIVEEKLIVQQSDIHAGQILIDYKGQVDIRPDMENKLREFYEREQYIKEIEETILFLPNDYENSVRRYPIGGCRTISGFPAR